MEVIDKEDSRGYANIYLYWDLVWNPSDRDSGIYQKVYGTEFEVLKGDANHVEVSFRTQWDPSNRGKLVPLNIDKRFVMLQGSSGFYTYAIYEHLQGLPDVNLGETRVVFKLRKDKFHYMAIADNRQRIMPMPDDRGEGRSEKLGYPEAVRLTDPINATLRGEVDDKYQYSCDNKDSMVHGWISSDPSVGFWVITPSNEFKSGGPVKQDLTSHVGPTALSMFVSSHYSGVDTVPKFRNGEYWKKVFGPVFIYLNSAPDKSDPKLLWEDAKKQMQVEVGKWPYEFPASEDFHKSEKRGSVSGRLRVVDKYINKEYINGNSAFVGLASPGEAGSWQRESKGYQFWVRADVDGNFVIKNVRTGVYNLYAWVPGFIGDYKSSVNITVTSGNHINLGNLVYNPPRDGPTLWEIGIPDRSAAEFFVPDPDPKYTNRLYVHHPDRFRQYGLWERYADLYPAGDLNYTIGVSDYRKDWFYAQVTRKDGQGSYQATTWQIRFRLDSVRRNGPYKLRVALAASHLSELQVRFNNPRVQPAHFTTGLIGRDNSIARHGIHGLYWLFSIDVESSWLLKGDNIIFLTQTRGQSPFNGVMYDYIRMEAPAGTVVLDNGIVQLTLSKPEGSLTGVKDHGLDNIMEVMEKEDFRGAILTSFASSDDLRPAATDGGVTVHVEREYVVLDNGIVQLTLSNPGGFVTGVKYHGLDNVMEVNNREDNRGYWDLVWNPSDRHSGIFQKIHGTEFDVVQQDANQAEVSFRTHWDPSSRDELVPLNIDKRFVMLRGSSGFYTYAIYEHLQDLPDCNLGETRVAFKLRKDKFHYMAIADNRQRIMPMPEDRQPGRSQKLDYPEAVRLTNPINAALRGEVDDKYQYSSENKDSMVHGWISSDPSVGFWVITPSNEFKSGGPVKQELTSHVGPTSLAIFVSSHYTGDDIVPRVRNGEYWKKVFGPVFIYLNSAWTKSDPKLLWEDAKKQARVEEGSWPYKFPASTDFQKSEQRGSVSGRLLVVDEPGNNDSVNGNAAFVGLASPGEAGSWQRESKGYQFWVRADVEGNF
uniref:rhamnogalacturonan endolyase n=1 Tax=Musa acuminata subsp. malaccensis TaxID=214687 RepID=A0A804HSV4_MUSAM